MHHIRPITDTDNLEHLTQLVRAAYQQLADLGFRYWGTWQSVEDTHRRVHAGQCYLAEHDDQILGVIVFHRPDQFGGMPWYDRSDVAGFHMFAVDPAHQRQGIGALLLARCEAEAAACGAQEIACDTAEGATQLIAMYQQRGYRQVETVDWDETNYRSVILSKRVVDIPVDTH